MPDMQAAAGDCALLVWDAESSPPVNSGKTVLWQTVSDTQSPDIVSLPLLIEQDADDLKARYLAWLRDVGQEQVGGLTLVQRLKLRDGFSYWWMTPLAEKCNYSKSPQIDHAIRLMAFADWAAEENIRRLVLATADENLATCFRAWCGNTGKSFTWQELPGSRLERSWARSLLSIAPSFIQAVAWLAKYVYQRRPLKNLGLKAWRETKAKLTFVSYSANLVPETARTGRYESLYWGTLPDMLRASEVQSNWMHLYVADATVPSLSDAKTIFEGFNANEGHINCHSMLDTFLSWTVVIKSLRDWLLLRKHGSVLPRSLQPSQSGKIEIGPLFEKEWTKSFLGKEALRAILYFNLVEAAIRALPPQDVGIYLQENQPWEMALIYAWKAAGHGQLIGVPHSTVRYWDLRYFFDQRDYENRGECCLPLPDLVGVNGSAAMQILRASGFPRTRLVYVEALRYLYLAELLRVKRTSKESAAATPLKILVLTDYDARNTRKQLRLLENSLHLLPAEVQITVKAHPTLPLNKADLPRGVMEISSRPLSELLLSADVVYASSVTSAAVEAYCAGLPVAALFDPASLNMSPLRGLNTVAFVHSPPQLAHALTNVLRPEPDGYASENFFALDTRLPRWRQLLGLPDRSLVASAHEFD